MTEKTKVMVYQVNQLREEVSYKGSSDACRETQRLSTSRENWRRERLQISTTNSRTNPCLIYPLLLTLIKSETNIWVTFKQIIAARIVLFIFEKQNVLTVFTDILFLF